MAEEPRITMSEFKTVVESFRSELRTVAEGVLGVRSEMAALETKLTGKIEGLRGEMHVGFHSLKEQVALLSDFNFQPKQMADMLGKSANNIRVTLFAIRKERAGAQAQSENIQENAKPNGEVLEK